MILGAIHGVLWFLVIFVHHMFHVVKNRIASGFFSPGLLENRPLDLHGEVASGVMKHGKLGNPRRKWWFQDVLIGKSSNQLRDFP